MTWILLANFAAVCVGLILWGMLRRGRIYEFPFLASATFLGYVLPQLTGLTRDPFLPPGALDKTIFMSLLCAAMCYFGHIAAQKPMRSFNWTFDDRRMLQVSAVYCFTGCYFYFLVSRLPKELTEVSQWTGLPVAYLFLAQTMNYGFIIALIIFVRKKSSIALGLFLYCTSFYYDHIVISGRRSVTFFFILSILLTLWYQRNWTAPRLLVLIGLIVGSLFVNSIGDYRSINAKMDENPGSSRWSQIMEIDFIGNFEKASEESSYATDLINTVYSIEAIDRNASFDFGLAHWNQLIFSYVPAQLLGRDVKSSLYLDLFDSDPAWTEFKFLPTTGSTATGIQDSFQSFWYFGCLKFFLIAFIMSKISKAAIAGNMVAQIIMCTVLVPAMESITHTTHYFVAPWVYMAMFLLPGLLYAAKRTEVVAPAIPR